MLLTVSCKKTIVVDEAYAYDSTPYTLNFINNTLPPINIPADNPLTNAKVQLGKMLFYEKALSLDNSMNCNTCHQQADGFSDKNIVSLGVQNALGVRQSMPLFNLALNNQFFWDGRASSLRNQVLKPIEDHLEMQETLPNVLLKLKAKGYDKFFNKAFDSYEITNEKLALALESFLFTLISDNSKYDRYLLGLETLTASEERGRALFFGEYNEFFPENSGGDCFHCHGGNNFQLNIYRNNGLDFESQFLDFGREKFTQNTNDRAKFKVPTLRNIEVTSPYMHDGRFSTLEEVVEHYNNNIKNSPTVDPTVLFTANTGLMLDDQEKQDLINFLKTLTDNSFLNNKEYASPF